MPRAARSPFTPPSFFCFQMMIDAESLEVEFGNTPAMTFYNTASSQMLRDNEKTTLHDIFRCCHFRDASEHTAIREQIRALTLQHAPVEVIVAMKRPGSTSEGDTQVSHDASFSRPLGSSSTRASASESTLSEASSEWQRLVFVPCLNPVSGRAALVLNQDDVTQLRQVQAELAAANRAQEEAFTALSHELRTPLSGIIGLADALAHSASSSSSLDPRTRSTLDIIKRTGQVLLPPLPPPPSSSLPLGLLA